MTCYTPIQAFKSSRLKPNGKVEIVFSNSNPDRAFFVPIELPCGRCIGCRLDYSRQWAIRCVHEASLFEHNCFITLTFSPESLSKRPFPESLDVRDFQLFMKRLRKKYQGMEAITDLQSGLDIFPIRFFHCGEYGEKNFRPHYHALLFNFDFLDREYWCTNNGFKLFRSESLEELWPFGHSSVGDLTFKSAAYVARYITKKINGDSADFHYSRVLEDSTGELLSVKPEYTTMSRRPGIGKYWYDSFKSDCYPSDSIHVNGVSMTPPKYYDKLLSVDDPDLLSSVKLKRKSNADLYSEHNTKARRETRLRVRERKSQMLKRSLDSSI